MIILSFHQHPHKLIFSLENKYNSLHNSMHCCSKKYIHGQHSLHAFQDGVVLQSQKRVATTLGEKHELRRINCMSTTKNFSMGFSNSDVSLVINLMNSNCYFSATHIGRHYYLFTNVAFAWMCPKTKKCKTLFQYKHAQMPKWKRF